MMMLTQFVFAVWAGFSFSSIDGFDIKHAAKNHEGMLMRKLEDDANIIANGNETRGTEMENEDHAATNGDFEASFVRLNAASDSQCAPGTQITSWEQCKEAAAALGLTWTTGDSYAAGDYHWVPPGCSYWPAQARSWLTGTELIFNKAGSNNGDQDSLCSQAPALSATPATGNRVTIYFEGFKAKTNSDISKDRPGFAKFKRCTSDSANDCTECPSETECGWTRMGTDWSVSTAGLDYAKTYMADFWVDCAQDAAAAGRLMVYIWSSTNAAIKAFMAEEAGQMTHRELQMRKTAWTGGSWGAGQGVFEAGTLIGSNRLSIGIKASASSQVATARVKVFVSNVEDTVSDCMDNKMCLKKLDDTEAGRELRESNSLQLKCLESGSLSSAQQTACDGWITCLHTHRAEMDILLAVLRASNPTSGVLLAQHEAATDDGKVAAGECLNPASDDPESWECECAPVLYAACSDRWGELLAACMKEKMCGSSKICPTWKQDNGCPGSLLSKQNQSMQKLPDGDSLEESLTDKRSC